MTSENANRAIPLKCVTKRLIKESKIPLKFDMIAIKSVTFREYFPRGDKAN